MAIPDEREQILDDYALAVRSRQVSLIGRREALTGKAKFGIFGDGKEVAQVALAHSFRPGDFRSGYYRDQTLMMALGLLSVEGFFAQLYADPDVANDPASAGRQMNAHFATRLLDDDGRFLPQTAGFNCAADSSPTGSQMPRIVGLTWASRLYRALGVPEHLRGFSNNGDEVVFGTIGNASSAEGLFWEAINAVGVLRGPLVMSIWDDEYGISVHNEHQLTKGDLSALLSGFARHPDNGEGYDLYTVRGWDYAALRATYERATQIARERHVPAIVHVIEVTQPQGHSTSGSHERYKSAERLSWEEEHDCLPKMRAWMLENGVASAETLDALEEREKAAARAGQQAAWEAFVTPIRAEVATAAGLIETLAQSSRENERIAKIAAELRRQPSPLRRHASSAAHQALLAAHADDTPARRALAEWRRAHDAENRRVYGSHLVSESAFSALAVPEVPAVYADDAPQLTGFEVLNRGFDAALARIPELIAFGEDVGKLGDVNQGFAGLQEKYGALRVADTGIREATIIGQAIGIALRGLRPIAEIQYLDYLLYGLQTLSDDLATLLWRTRGGQKAPVIVRTRGHRLEGVWHSGSPMAGILGLVRGMYLCVPRNMTQAVGFYNTLLQSDDSAIVIEVLNGYRAKERLASNLDSFTVPLGVPEILREGEDVTLVTYGACCKIALEACERLAQVGIDVELIDARTLLPFDRPGIIGRSLQKTNRIVFLDEDVPGGGTAYMLQEVLERQRGFAWLDSEPRTLPAAPHRPAYGSDGDYWSKPNVEDVFETVYELMHEAEPARHPLFYR